MENETYDFVLKLTIIGDCSVGKSNIISKYVHNIFLPNSTSTVGVEIGNKILDFQGMKLKLVLWDTAGQERYKAITNSFYNQSKGAIVVFDLTCLSSFNSVKRWCEEYSNIAKNNFIVAVGNKLDLIKERVVSNDQIQELSKQLNVKFMTASALTGENVNNCFDELIQLLHKNNLMSYDEDSEEENSVKPNGITLSTKTETKEEGCGC